LPSKVKSKSEIRIGFFELLWGDREGNACIFSTDPVAPKTQVKEKFFQWPKESLKLENYLLTEELKHNVYFCVSLLSKMERKKANCLPTNLVWADLDEVPPDSPNIEIPPPIVIESSPDRWQAIWRLTTELEPYDAERYSKRLAYAIEADKSGWDMVQLLRVPFSRNFKYADGPYVNLERALATEAPVSLFEAALPAPPEEAPVTDRPMPEASNAEDIIATFSKNLPMDRFLSLYAYEPEAGEDWSKMLWALYMLCFRAGMSAEEVFVVAKAASCNKFERDGRPVEHLWRDVLNAADSHGSLPPEKALLEMPQLVGEPASETFIDEYLSWADEATDAVAEFHELSAFIILSAIMAGSLRLETSAGKVVPNIWGLVLGESTVTRKSTSMKMAVDLLTNMESELLLATDGSVEGLLSGLSQRPNKVSVFFRDEVSGLFDSMNRRDYLSSMPETLAHLYDVPPVYSRLLRKEVIRIESPAFIFFGGGIAERVYGNITESWIESGFIPRFMVVHGEFDSARLRPTGPPTASSTTKRAGLVDTLADYKETYSSDAITRIGGQEVLMPPLIIAEMTDDAWQRFQDIENTLTVRGYESLVRNTALPTFDRMAKSILKMGMCLAASRQYPDPKTNRIQVTEDDIINAAWYAQKWGRHSVELILSAGKGFREKEIDRVYRKIAQDPGVMRSTVMQHLHLRRREMDELIDTLEDRNMIRKEKTRGSRGVRYFVV
jgi:hypothetical protein